jgi:hypothetical protein
MSFCGTHRQHTKIHQIQPMKGTSLKTEPNREESARNFANLAVKLLSTWLGIIIAIFIDVFDTSEAHKQGTPKSFYALGEHYKCMRYTEGSI